MKIRLPASLSLFAVPAVCLVLLAAAWTFMRGGGEAEAPAAPVLRLLCEESLQAPLAGIVAAYERRGGTRVELELVPSSGLAERLAGGAESGLLLLAAGNPLADEGIGKAIFPEIAAAGPIRVFALGRREPSEPLAGFIEFLSGPFATGILQRFESPSGASPP